MSPGAVTLQKECEAQNDGLHFPLDLSKSPGLASWLSPAGRRGPHPSHPESRGPHPSHRVVTETLLQVMDGTVQQRTPPGSAPALPPSRPRSLPLLYLCRRLSEHAPRVSLLPEVCTQRPAPLQTGHYAALRGRESALAGWCPHVRHSVGKGRSRRSSRRGGCHQGTLRPPAGGTGTRVSGGLYPGPSLGLLLAPKFRSCHPGTRCHSHVHW